MKTQIFESLSDFLEREERDMNGVDQEFAEEHPNYEKQNGSNKG
jgi:hypothetical protein